MYMFHISHQHFYSTFHITFRFCVYELILLLGGGGGKTATKQETTVQDDFNQQTNQRLLPHSVAVFVAPNVNIMNKTSGEFPAVFYAN